MLHFIQTGNSASFSGSNFVDLLFRMRTFLMNKSAASFTVWATMVRAVLASNGGVLNELVNNSNGTSSENTTTSEEINFTIFKMKFNQEIIINQS